MTNQVINKPKNIKEIELNKLKRYKRNSRTHSDSQIDKIASSILEFGFTVPLLIDGKKNIIAGHGRLEAAKKLGMETVPCIELKHLTEEQRKAYLIADNKLTEDGGWDEKLLAEELQALADVNFDVSLTGFSDKEFNKLLKGLVNDTDDTLEPKTSEFTEARRICKPGELWQLDRHKLLCGDCTSFDSISLLFEDKKAQMLLTDPPYGVDYSGKNEMLNKVSKGNRNQDPIKNDAIKDYREFFGSFLGISPLDDYNTCYIFMSGLELHNLRMAFEDKGYTWGDYLLWVKNNHVLGRKDYNAKHEFILYGWKGKHKFYGDGSCVTVFNEPKPLSNDVHPTMKPIPLLERLLLDGSKREDIVYDPFLGSGSTLLACEKLARACYGIEFQPKYCDVIINRWQEMTGQEAFNLTAGKSYSEITHVENKE